MDPNTITLGKYSLPVILSLILNLVFKKTTIADDLKPYIAVGCGMILGVAALFYNNIPVSFPLVMDYVLAGAVAGTSATGIYEMIKPQGPKKYGVVDKDGKRIPGAKVVVARPKLIG